MNAPGSAHTGLPSSGSGAISASPTILRYATPSNMPSAWCLCSFIHQTRNTLGAGRRSQSLVAASQPGRPGRQPTQNRQPTGRCSRAHLWQPCAVVFAETGADAGLLEPVSTEPAALKRDKPALPPSLDDDGVSVEQSKPALLFEPGYDFERAKAAVSSVHSVLAHTTEKKLPTLPAAPGRWRKELAARCRAPSPA